MQVDFKAQAQHFWIIIFWLTFGTIIFGVIAAITCWIRKCSSSYRKKRKKNVRRAQSVAEINPQTLTASTKRNIFQQRSASSEHDNSETEQSEKSPLVSAKLETFAKLLFKSSISTSSTPTGTQHQQQQQHHHQIKQHFVESNNVMGRAGIGTSRKSISSSGGHDIGSGGGGGRRYGGANRPYSSCDGNSSINSRDSQSISSRHSLTYQYSALECGNGANERSVRERTSRDRGLNACREWIKTTTGRYEIIQHLDDIGSRNNKHWFLLNDTTVRTDRLMTLLPLPPDCVALEELPATECPKGIIMELLSSLQHPYIYPVLDLGFLYTNSIHYACLVMPFNSRGSLKDLIYKAQWNDTWNRKYTRKSTCLPFSQVQRLGRQILEALLFLKERGFPSHGHLHSGNIILQNGVARLSGLENGLLGLNSRVNAVMWSRNVSDIENMDIICFGHLLFEMCAGYELNSPQPTAGHLELDLERYPQIAEVLQLIFDSPDNQYPTVEDLVLCELFRNIDLREMRSPCITSFKQGLSSSTLNLLNAVRRRQGQSLCGTYYSECSTPLTPPSTPRDRRTSLQRDLESGDITSESDELDTDNYNNAHDADDDEDEDDDDNDNEQDIGTLNEIIITDTSNYNFNENDLLNSPIHICDQSEYVQSDENNTISNSNTNNINTTTIRLNDNNICLSSTTIIDDHHSIQQIYNEPMSRNGSLLISSNVNASSSSNIITPSQSSNQLTTDINVNKNSKSRRMEYSKKGMKLCCSSNTNSNNPSQDSAFGSMTDGDFSIASSSLRMSSFQSITSPIDEDVEDIIIAIDDDDDDDDHHQLNQSINESKSSIMEDERLLLNLNNSCDSVGSKTTNISASSIISGSTINHLLAIEPPKILVNDQNSFYTTSPSKAFNTIEVFSQKYRVSSFEDVTMRRSSLKNVNKLAFRSLEDERRIDTAFLPLQYQQQEPQNNSSQQYLNHNNHKHFQQHSNGHVHHHNQSLIAQQRSKNQQHQQQFVQHQGTNLQSSPPTSTTIPTIINTSIATSTSITTTTATSTTSANNRVFINNNEKFKKLTHAAFSRKIIPLGPFISNTNINNLASTSTGFCLDNREYPHQFGAWETRNLDEDDDHISIVMKTKKLIQSNESLLLDHTHPIGVTDSSRTTHHSNTNNNNNNNKCHRYSKSEYNVAVAVCATNKNNYDEIGTKFNKYSTKSYSNICSSLSTVPDAIRIRNTGSRLLSGRSTDDDVIPSTNKMDCYKSASNINDKLFNIGPQQTTNRLCKRVASHNEISTVSKPLPSSSSSSLNGRYSTFTMIQMDDDGAWKCSSSPIKSKSERHLLGLTTTQNNTMMNGNNNNSSGSYHTDLKSNFVKCSNSVKMINIENDKILDNPNNNNNSVITLSHRDACKSIGGISESNVISSLALSSSSSSTSSSSSSSSACSPNEEKTPLLYGMEMSPISPPIECDEML